MSKLSKECLKIVSAATLILSGCNEIRPVNGVSTLGPVATPTSRDVEPTPSPTPVPEFTPVPTVKPTEVVSPTESPTPIEISKVSINTNSVDLVGIVDGFGGGETGDYMATVESVKKAMEEMYGSEESNKSVELFLGNENNTPWLGAFTDREMTVVPEKIDGLELVVEESSREKAVYTDPEGKRYSLETGYELDEKPLYMFWFRETGGGLRLGYILKDGNMGLGQVEREMVEVGLIEVPSGVDSVIWTKAVVAGGSEGAEWSNQFNTVIWRSDQGNIARAWDAEFNYVGVIVGEPGREVVVRKDIRGKPTSYAYGSNIYDNEGRFLGLGVNVKEIQEAADGTRSQEFEIAGKVIGFESMDLNRYFDGVSEFGDITPESIRDWRIMIVRTEVGGIESDIRFLLRPESMPDFKQTQNTGGDNYNLKVADQIFGSVMIGDRVNYIQQVYYGFGSLDLNDWCQTAIMKNEQAKVWSAISSLRLISRSIQSLGFGVGESVLSMCPNPMITGDGVKKMINDIGPILPAGYWDIAK